MNEIFEYLNELIKENVKMTQDALQSKSDRYWLACSNEYEKLSKIINNRELQESFLLIINEIMKSMLCMNNLLIIYGMLNQVIHLKIYKYYII